ASRWPAAARFPPRKKTRRSSRARAAISWCRRTTTRCSATTARTRTRSRWGCSRTGLAPTFVSDERDGGGKGRKGRNAARRARERASVALGGSGREGLKDERLDVPRRAHAGRAGDLASTSEHCEGRNRLNAGPAREILERVGVHLDDDQPPAV